MAATAGTTTGVNVQPNANQAVAAGTAQGLAPIDLPKIVPPPTTTTPTLTPGKPAGGTTTLRALFTTPPDHQATPLARALSTGPNLAQPPQPPPVTQGPQGGVSLRSKFGAGGTGAPSLVQPAAPATGIRAKFGTAGGGQTAPGATPTAQPQPVKSLAASLPGRMTRPTFQGAQIATPKVPDATSPFSLLKAPSLASKANMVGSAAANIADKGVTAEGFTPQKIDTTVKSEVGGALKALGGAAKLATAFTDETQPTAARIGTGVSGGVDLVQSAEALGLIDQLPFSGELGAIGAGAGAAAAGINLAVNWDRMEDYQKALGAAQLVSGGLAMAGYAIPYAGPILAIAGLAGNLFNSEGSYDKNRRQAAADVQSNYKRVLEGLADARSDWEINRVIETANRSSGRARWNETGVGAYEMDTSKVGKAMQDLISAKRLFWTGKMTEDHPMAKTMVSLAVARNQKHSFFYDLFFTPEGIRSKEAVDMWNTIRPGDAAGTKWGEIAVEAGIPVTPDGQWPDDVMQWAARTTPELRDQWEAQGWAGRLPGVAFDQGAVDSASGPFVMSAGAAPPSTKTKVIQLPKWADPRHAQRKMTENVLQAKNDWELGQVMTKGEAAYNLPPQMASLVEAKHQLFKGTLKPDHPMAHATIALAKGRNNDHSYMYNLFFTPEGIASAKAKEVWDGIGGSLFAHPGAPKGTPDAKWREIRIRAGIDTPGGVVPTDIGAWQSQVKAGQATGLTKPTTGSSMQKIPKWGEKVKSDTLGNLYKTLIGEPVSGPQGVQATPRTWTPAGPGSYYRDRQGPAGAPPPPSPDEASANPDSVGSPVDNLARTIMQNEGVPWNEAWEQARRVVELGNAGGSGD